MNALSLFSGAGIGDIGLRASGFNFLGFCELEGDRLQLTESNFPNAKFFVGDIWESYKEVISYFKDKELKLISCTAPCQGMSKNGQGTLLKNIREGKRPKLDPRNRLIIPAIEIIKALKPEFVIFENVPEMRRTYIENSEGEVVSILQLIDKELKPLYVGCAYDVEFADYGIPQRRQRLITVYSKNSFHINNFSDDIDLVPPPTHSKVPTEDRKSWISVMEAIKDFPPLDAKDKKHSICQSIDYHRVPLLDENKYFWVSNTPIGKTAFDNQCIKCGSTENPAHSTGRNLTGVNQASKSTPIYCVKCNALLPRPTVKDESGNLRLMSGFTSAYKRMVAELPSPTLTRNFSYACSDSKIHPTQHRVLSIAEALKIHSLSEYSYKWSKHTDKGEVPASDGLIRLVIGESIPPKFMELLGKYLIETSEGKLKVAGKKQAQLNLFK